MIHSSIEINAPPSRVRDVLLTFDAYPTWHTGFITSIASSRESAEKGKDTLSNKTNTSAQEMNLAAKGDEIHGVMGGVTFTAVVLESSANVFSWTGPPFYHLFRGVHTFRFSPSVSTPGSTTFVQEESFTGVLAWVMAERGPIGRKVRGMFEGFNQDLKVEAEKGVVRDG
ncbi:hypothetical protein BDR22DRAFT_829375 [Usnea florida]